MNSTGIGRSRWAAIGAAVAVCLGAGGIGITQAATSSGEKAIYKPIEPCRLIDTRPAPYTVGTRTTPLTAGNITLSGWGAVGDCTLPSGTTGLSLNVTAVSATQPTFLTLYPTGGSLPSASHLNPVPGDFATPNAVNVDLNAAGNFNVYNLQGAVDVIIDVVGLYDDHNHDDRYYTKSQTYTQAEVDALVAGAGGGGVSAFAEASAPDADGKVELGNAAAPEQVVASVTVNAPAAGSVVLNYSLFIVPSNLADPARVECSVGTITTKDLSIGAAGQGSSVEQGVRSTLSGTKLIDVAAGNTTFHVVCDTVGGGTGELDAAHPTLTAIYTPAP